MNAFPVRTEIDMDSALQVLNEILEDEKQKTNSDMEDDDFFELFSAEQVLRHMRLIPSSINDGIVGKGNDGGIDSAYIFVNGKMLTGDIKPEDLDHYQKNVVLDWVITQATRESSFKEDVLQKIQLTLGDILDLALATKDLRKSYNAGVVEMAERFRVAKRKLQLVGVEVNVNVFYACKGDTSRIDKKIGEAQKPRLEKSVVTNIPGTTTCKVTFMGARELADLASKIPPTKRTLECEELFYVSGGYVCFVALDKYSQFISDNGTLLRYLFESNVRDYLEDVDVNKEIKDSLGKPTGEDFWMLNNGITIIAEGAVPGQSKTLVVDDPQIVNGLQTSEEIFNYASTLPNPEHLKRRVMVRVITSTAPDSQDRIIKATNRQTGITAAQLHATEQVHRDIEKIFPSNGLFYDRRKKYWQYKTKPKAQVISIQDLSQALMAIFEQRPDTARARPGDVFSKKKADLYQKLYDPKNPPDLYVNCATILRMSEHYLRDNKMPRGAANDLRFYLAMAFSVLLAKSLEPTADQLAKLAPKGAGAQVMDSAYALAYLAYTDTGEDEDAAKGPKMLTRLIELLKEELGI